MTNFLLHSVMCLLSPYQSFMIRLRISTKSAHLNSWQMGKAKLVQFHCIVALLRRDIHSNASELFYWNVHWEIVATLHQPTKTAFSNILFYWKDKFIKISKNEFSYVKSSKLLFKNIDKILGGTRKDISVLKLSMDVKTRKTEISFKNT